MRYTNSRGLSHSILSAFLACAVILLTPALAQAQTTRVDDRDPYVRYSDHWLRSDQALASSSTVTAAFEAGASVSVAFSGTGISWIGYRCRCAAGFAKLYVDGKFVATVDTYSLAPQPKAEIYRVRNLAPGNHVLTIEATGEQHSAGSTAYIAVDAFDIEGGGALLPTDTKLPDVVLTAPRNDSSHAGRIAMTADAFDDIRLSNVTFLVDGVPVAEDSTAPFSAVWDSSNVSEGAHVVTAVAHDWAGNESAAPARLVYIINSVLVEQNDASVSYKGQWISRSHPGFSNGTAVAAFEQGASATVRFRGTGIMWIGYSCLCATGEAIVRVDGQVQRMVSTYQSRNELQANIYRIDGLPDSEHTLTIEHTGEYNRIGETGYLVLDAFRVLRETADRDATPPAAQVDFPAAGATIGSVVRVQASLSDARGITGTKFFVDGVPLNNVRQASSMIDWNTLRVANGQHTLNVLAWDAEGNATLSPGIDVIVSNAANAGRAVVNLTSPAAGASVSGIVTLTASATGVPIGRVRFFAGDVFLGEDATAPYSITRDASQIPDGSRYALTAQAVDLKGYLVWSPANEVTVRQPGSAQ